MSLRQKSIKGVVWSFTETIGVRIFSVSIYFLLAKILGPEPFGLVALTSSVIFFTSLVIDQGFAEALIQRQDLKKEHLYSAFWGISILGFVFFLLMFLSAPVIASFYKEPMMEDILRVHAFNFIIGSSGLVHRAILMKNFNFKVVAYGRIVGIVLGGIVSIVMAYNNFGAWCLVAQHLIFSFVQTVTFWISSGWIPKIYFSWKLYKSLFSFGSKVLATRMISNFNQYSYNLIIGYAFDTTVLGYFSFALKVFTTISDVVNLSVSKVLLPLFSNIQQDRKRLEITFFKASYLMLYSSLPLFIALLVFIPDLIELTFGTAWAPSRDCMQILAISGVSVMILCIYESFQIGIGKPENNITINLINFSAGIISLLLLMDFGLTGAAWSFVIKYFVSFVYILWWLNKSFEEIKSYILNIAKPIIVFSFIALLIVAVSPFFQSTLPYLVIYKALMWMSLSLVAILIFNPDLLKMSLGLISKK
ncbi:lipopolysaccharide biosynthesis protein [Cesiribacter sp. SM1]|uniref:lipopolysaccharide biosynthesis protein n=1 Tax=Cesiribacter sp. SM1 TaxID=2861196 RepID=UPI001CD3175A|nr:lipopolysaccharide biosynthesis protein [Cesiribacter sp. SM1]